MATIDPLGRVTVTAYDALHRPLTQTRTCTDGSGAPRTSSCAAGHGAGNDENLVTTTAYTTRGLVDYRLDPLGRKTAFAYDGLGRVTAQTANAGGAVAPADVATTHTYDDANRLKKVEHERLVAALVVAPPAAAAPAASATPGTDRRATVPARNATAPRGRAATAAPATPTPAAPPTSPLPPGRRDEPGRRPPPGRASNRARPLLHPEPHAR